MPADDARKTRESGKGQSPTVFLKNHGPTDPTLSHVVLLPNDSPCPFSITKPETKSLTKEPLGEALPI